MTLPPADATLKLNGRSFKIIKLLGEGGFSYVGSLLPVLLFSWFAEHALLSDAQVYLAQDLASGRQFALKKIRCPLGSESVRVALKEVEGKQSLQLARSFLADSAHLASFLCSLQTLPASQHYPLLGQLCCAGQGRRRQGHLLVLAVLQEWNVSRCRVRAAERRAGRPMQHLLAGSKFSVGLTLT